MSRTHERLAHFTRGYAHAMLWANTSLVTADDLSGMETVDPAWWQRPSPDWAIEAFTEEAQASIHEDCDNFFAANLRDLMAYTKERLGTSAWHLLGLATDPNAIYRVWAEAGHDFALTRNGHGAGFWDRGLGELGDRLSKAAKVYGSSNGWLSADENLVTLGT